MFWQACAPGAGARPDSSARPDKGGGADVDAAANSHAISDGGSDPAAYYDLDADRHSDCCRACPIQHHNAGTCSANRDAVAVAGTANRDTVADAGTTNRDTVADTGNVGGHRDASQDF